MDVTATTAPYLGWLREPPGRWRPVVGGESYGATWRRLLAVKAGRVVEMVVLRRGQKP